MKIALLQPGKIGNVTVKNRIVMSPMGSFFNDPDGTVNDRTINYYAARAKGGTGMITVEFTGVHPSGQSAGALGIWDDKFLPGLTRLADAIKEHGSTAAIQLAHCGRQAGASATGAPLVAASPIPCPVCCAPVKEMTEADIWEAIESFGTAALRARKAGFEVIAIHAAHGYLIQNFLSPYSNKRTDEWGGSFENRIKFLKEIIAAVRKNIGPDYPLIARISIEEIAEGGLVIEDQLKLAKLLEAWGVDMVDISIGTYGYQEYLIPPMDMPLAINADKAARVKAELNIPVSVVGRINDPFVANQIIDEGKADFVDMGRALIADPEFANKTARGDWDSIVKCVACNQGCFGQSLFCRPLQCLRNPCVGFEKEYELVPTENKKKVLVVGGGPAGLEAATTLVKRGHDVILCERTSSLGGQFYLAGVDPRKKEMSDAALQMGRNAVRAGIKVRLQTEVTKEVIEEIAPDVVILATGSVPFIPPILGADGDNVVTAHEILAGTKTANGKVAILGGNAIGTEVADFLAENGKDVTVIEMRDAIAADLDFVRQRLLLTSLNKYGVKRMTGSKCIGIEGNTVLVEKDGATMQLRDIDTVIIAAGVRAYNPLEEQVTKLGIPYYVIGDAQKPAKIINAIQQAAKVAREI